MKILLTLGILLAFAQGLNPPTPVALPAATYQPAPLPITIQPTSLGQEIALYSAAAVIIIGAFFNGVVLVIAARRVGSIHQKVDTIEVNTNSRLTAIEEQKQALLKRLEGLTLHRVEELTAERDALAEKVAAKEAEIVHRADAAPAQPPIQRSVRETDLKPK